MERMRKATRYGRDALLTPSNLLSGARMVGGLDLVRRISTRKTSPLGLVAEHVGVSITDLIDGRFARRDGPTAFGEFLDPLADKVQVLGELTALTLKGEIPPLPVAIIAAREIAITKYRADLKKEHIDLPARKLGQVKTWSQLVTIGVALLPEFPKKKKVVQTALWVTAGLTVISGADIVAHGQRKRRENLAESKSKHLRAA